MDIEIGIDTLEAEEFCKWLNLNGHNAWVGRSTGSYVNGKNTFNSCNANEIFNNLWVKYCRSC